MANIEMAKYKEFSGKYREVFSHVKMPGTSIRYDEVFCSVNTEEINKSIIQADLERQRFVDFNGKTRDSFRKAWEKPDVSLTYAQGNMTGGALSKTILDTYVVPKAHNGGVMEESTTLCFAYFDDSNPSLPCGFSLSYVNSDPSVWSIAIFKNTTASPDKMDVVSVSHESLIETGVAKKFQLKNLLNKLGSKSIKQLLKNIILADGRVNEADIKLLHTRIEQKHAGEAARQNIDDRDLKTSSFMEIMDKALDVLSETSQLEGYFSTIASRSVSDINFYEDTQYDATIFEISEVVQYGESLKAFQNKLAKIKQSSQALYQQGFDIIYEIQQISLLEPKSAFKLNEVLQCCSKALDHPKDETNIKRMIALSEEVSGKESPAFKRLGIALKVFALLFVMSAIVSIALMIFPAAPIISVGFFALLYYGGLAGSAIAFAGGSKASSRGERKGLAESLSMFKSLAIKQSPTADSESGKSSPSTGDSDEDSGHFSEEGPPAPAPSPTSM